MAKDIATQKGGPPAQKNNWLADIARQEGIPATGITIMGGRPYINVTGLDVKLANKCRDENKEHIAPESRMIQEAKNENGMLAGFYASVVLFDKEKYLQALKPIKEPTVEILRELRETFTERYSAHGWASPRTCKGIGYEYKWVGKGKKQAVGVLVENIIMMAERRATNRAKREATGTGLTSLDELPVDAAAQNSSQEAPVSYEYPEEEEIRRPVEKTGSQGPSRSAEDEEAQRKKRNEFAAKVKQYVNTREFKEWCKKNAIPNMKDVKDLVSMYHDETDLSQITLDMVHEWEDSINEMRESLDDAGVKDDSGQRENSQGRESDIGSGEDFAQGELPGTA